MAPAASRHLALLAAVLVLLASLPLGAPSVVAGASAEPETVGPVGDDLDSPPDGLDDREGDPREEVARSSTPDDRPDSSDVADGTSRRLTLVTGETVVVETDGDEPSIEAVEGGPVDVLEAGGETYLLPADVDLGVYDRSLFELDALLAHGNATPVLLEVDGSTDDTDLGELGNVRRLCSSGAVVAEVDSAAARETVADLVADGTVERVSRDRRVEHAGLPASPEPAQRANETGSGERTTSTREGATASGDGAAPTGEGVTVAVVDTGIDADHPDLADRVVDRIDLVGDGDGPLDPNGHGTHVAGVLAGTGAAGDESGDEDDGPERAGVAPGVDLVDVRVMNDRGSGRASTIAEGVERAVEADVDVVLLSVSTSIDGSDVVAEAVEWATEQGVVVVAAAGNAGRPRSIGAPGRPPGAITVGAVDGRGSVASYSSRGPTLDGHLKPELVAPGDGTVGPRSNGSGRHAVDDEGRYTRMGGTSVAAPQAAGAAALLLEAEPGLTAGAIESRLTSTARPVRGAGIYAQGGGVLDVERALDPDVLAHPGVVDLGLLEDGGAANRTIVLENRDDRRHVLELDATVRNEDLGRSADDVASLNRSELSLEPGERAAVELHVDGDAPSGAYAGAIRYAVDGEPRSLPIGFLRGGRVTVEKRPLSPGSRVDGEELWVLNERGTHDELLEFENGTADFVAGGGTYLLWSAGTDEATDATVFLSERRRFDGPTRVVLDERSTVPVGVDVAPIVDRYGPLANRTVSVSLSTDYGEETARRTILRRETGSRTVRVSPDPDLDVATAHLLVAGSSGRAAMDADDVFYLVNGVDGVEGPDLVEATPEALETTEYRYHRRTVDETYRVQDRATVPGVWNRPALQWLDLGGRTTQRIHRFPDAADYRRSLRGDGWDADRPLGDGSGERRLGNRGVDRRRPDGAQVPAVDVLSHPMLGLLDVEYAGNGAVSASVTPFVDGDGTRYDPGGTHVVTVLRDGEVVTERAVGGDVTLDDLALGGDGSLTVRLAGENADGRLSTSTLTEVTLPTNYTGSISPSAVTDRPPAIRDLRVLGTDAANAVGPGEVTVAVDADLVGNVVGPRVWYSTSPGSEPPWRNRTGWTEAETEKDDGRVLATVRIPADAESLHLAASLSDVRDRRARTMTTDAVHVGAAPNASTAMLRGQFLAADGTPADNDTIGLRRADGGSVQYLRTDEAGRFSVEVPRSRNYDLTYFRGEPWGAPKRVEDGRPAWLPLERVSVGDEDVDLGARTLPRAGSLLVNVTDERGEPVPGATVRVSQRSGNVSVADRLRTGEDGLATRFGSDRPGIELAGAVDLTVTPPEDSLYPEQTFETTVEVDGSRTVDVVVETEPPEAVLTAFGRFEPGEPLFLHARKSQVPAGVEEYRWDLDGDGEVDRVTSKPALRYVPEAGTSEPTLTVVDRAGKRDADSIVVRIEDDGSS